MKFFCFAYREQRASPTRALKAKLQNAGLGERRYASSIPEEMLPMSRNTGGTLPKSYNIAEALTS